MPTQNLHYICMLPLLLCICLMTNPRSTQPVLPLQEQYVGVVYYMPYPFDILTHLIPAETLAKRDMEEILSHLIQSLNVRAGVPSQDV